MKTGDGVKHRKLKDCLEVAVSGSRVLPKSRRLKPVEAITSYCKRSYIFLLLVGGGVVCGLGGPRA